MMALNPAAVDFGAPSRVIKPGCGVFFWIFIFWKRTAENLTKQYKSLLSEGTACSRHNWWYLVLVGPTQLCKTYYQDVRIWTTLSCNGTGTFVKQWPLPWRWHSQMHSLPIPDRCRCCCRRPGFGRFHVSHERAKVGKISMLIQRLWEETWQNHEQDHHRDP